MYQNLTSENRTRQVIEVDDIVTRHGDLSIAAAIVKAVYPETHRVSLAYWCDVRECWIDSAVDSCRIRYAAALAEEIGACTCCGRYEWYCLQDDDGTCPDCQLDHEAEAALNQQAAEEAAYDQMNRWDRAYEIRQMRADWMED